jgi:hypothetical protein
MKFTLIRYLKILFAALKLHRFSVLPDAFYLNLVYMRKLSQWIHEQKNRIPNDFPSRWDYQKRYDFYEEVLKKENVNSGAIDYFEFGVAHGHSFQWFLRQNTSPESTFNGFDTFTGLPEDFGIYKKGTFNTNNQIPEINDSRGNFHQGLFQKTLPAFLKSYRNKNRKIIMLDADLYSATLFVLTSMAPFLQENDLIFFDEFSVPTQEFKAFYEFQQAYPHLPLESIAAANNFYFTAFRVGKLPS